MKDKGILNLLANDKERKLNFITKDDKLLIITSGTSQKINDMKANNNVSLIFSENEVVSAKANIIEDKEVVKEVFEDFNKAKNNHFKELKDEFVVVEFTIRQ